MDEYPTDDNAQLKRWHALCLKDCLYGLTTEEKEELKTLSEQLNRLLKKELNL